MIINDKKVNSENFAYDGCHKIYIVENIEEIYQAIQCGYNIYNIRFLEECYENSCSLKFISSWDLETNYVKQFEKATFKYEN